MAVLQLVKSGHSLAGHEKTIWDYVKDETMSASMMTTLGEFISSKILKQPNRKINPDELLISSGMIDSFSLIDLALFVEDSFNVHIDDSELNAQTFDSLTQLAALIDSRQKK
jgi:acyl carrier protein